MVFSKYDHPIGRQKYKHKQPLPTPEFTNISIKTQTFERLKLYGAYDDMYDQILNKLMDVVDGKRKGEDVIRSKQWYRDSSFGKKILGTD